MGVLACDRAGCRNIMCDRFSQCFQSYLCNECFDELVEQGPGTDITTFLNSVKTSTYSNREASRAYFDSFFPSRYDDES